MRTMLEVIRTGEAIRGDPYRIDTGDVVSFDPMDLVLTTDDMVRVNLEGEAWAAWTMIPRAELNNARKWEAVPPRRKMLAPVA